MQILARRYDTDQPVRLDVRGGKIAESSACLADGHDAARLPRVAPGLIDVQVNGYGGLEFCCPQSTPETVARIARAMDAFGVTRFCPTLTTERFEVLRDALGAIVAACESSADVARRIAGIHLEGPYIAVEEGPRGAHPRQHCRPPDWDEFQRLQEAAGGRIRILTMSVEFDRAPQFIRQVAATGVVVAIGHTAADSAQIRAAVDAGARLSTHLGNGCHPMLPRHRNYVWDQLAEDRLWASLICDGHHLPPELIKTFVRAKTPARCILVSDMTGPAGLPPGRYPCNLCEIEVLPGGRLVIAGQRDLMAGASLPVGVGVANVIHSAGVSLAEVVSMASGHPARLLGIEPGGLEPGHPADLVLFDLVDPAGGRDAPQFEVRATLLGGEVVFGAV